MPGSVDSFLVSTPRNRMPTSENACAARGIEVLRLSIQRVGDVAEIRGHNSIAIVDSSSISGKIV